MLIIGLTGGIGCGKSTVANLFAEHGITVIDSDQLSRDITQPGTPALKKIIHRFGNTIIHHDGKLNRAALRKIIFSNEEDRIWLEQLLHPLIRKEMQSRIMHAPSPYSIIVVPLLFETKRNPLINRVLVIDTPVEEQIRRALVRDNSTIEDVAAILKTQVSRETRLAKADDIIYNHGLFEELSPQVNKLHQFYLTLSK